MWRGRDKVWLQYRRDILAADISSGVFMSDYMRHISINCLQAQYLEIADLQRYKLVKSPNKVKMMLRERSEIPFVFVLGKN